MASFSSSGWPSGATVNVYAQDAFGNQTGASVTSAVASSAGVAAFTGLADATKYVASDGSRSVRFGTPVPSTAGAPAAGSVTAAMLTDIARTGGFLPSGAIDETIPLRVANVVNTTLVSGQLKLSGGIIIPGGVTVHSITFASGSQAAVTPTNQWFCLIDKTTLAVLATTVDDTTTGWAVNIPKTLALTATFTPSATVEAYVGIMVAAATPPTVVSTNLSTVVSAITPMVTANANTGLTNPASLGAVTLLSGSSSVQYAYIS